MLFGIAAPTGAAPVSGGVENRLRFRLQIELQRVVEAVECAAERDPPGEFDDLFFAEMRFQPLENPVAHAPGAVVDLNREVENQAVDIVEFRMVSGSSSRLATPAGLIPSTASIGP